MGVQVEIEVKYESEIVWTESLSYSLYYSS